jgi:SAM-dependent methyltransferase
VSPTEAQKAEASSGAKVFVGDILDAPFSASTFDVITGFHVLEHVYKPKQIVGKLLEWLKPGGILYLHVPNIDALEARVFQSYWYGLELPRHLYHFSPASLSRLFAFYDLEELILRTLSHNHIEASIHYVREEIRARLGISRIPLSTVHKSPGITWRIIRKALRLSLFEPFGFLSAAVGRGAGIEVMYRKRASEKSPVVK